MSRGHSGSLNENSTYSFYCRNCGNVMKRTVFPIMCSVCGNILIDDGFGVSGDTTGGKAGNELGSTSLSPRIALRITNLDKTIR